MVELKKCSTTYKLSNGKEIPAIALGTWLAKEGEVYQSVLEALKVGYRHIDTAAFYGNEVEIGKAIRDSGIPREEVFLTTKLWPTQFKDPVAGLDESLKKLGLDYVDLYLMHWPIGFKTDLAKDGNIMIFPKKANGCVDVDMDLSHIKVWEVFQNLPESKARSLGISNFSVNNIKTLLAASSTKKLPVAHQFEIHPLLPQNELVNFSKEKGMVVEAYCPLGGPDSSLVTNPVLQSIAKKLDINVGQLMISWGVQRGYVVLPKSIKPERIESNLKICSIPEEDFEAINNLSKEVGEKRSVDFDCSPFPLFK